MVFFKVLKAETLGYFSTVRKDKEEHTTLLYIVH